jgi:hypothetical protein
MRLTLLLLCCAALWMGACGDDDDVNADRLGVGAECTSDDDCLQSRHDGGLTERCLMQFKGGYCGIVDCEQNADCPEGSACVIHEDGRNYCFRTCANKPECNRNRSAENESNCSSNVDYTDGDKDTIGKACVPPSDG